MKLNSIGHLSILSKALIYFSLIASILIAAYLHTIFIKSRFDNSQRAYEVANKLHETSLQINLASIMIIRNNQGAKEQLDEYITKYEQNFYLLKNGGSHISKDKKVKIKKLGEFYENDINKIERLWSSYKTHAGNIYTKQSAENFDAGVSIYIQNSSDIFKSFAAQTMPKEVLNSLEYLERNALNFINTNRTIAEKLRNEAEENYNAFNWWLLTYGASILFLLFIGYLIFRKNLYKRFSLVQKAAKSMAEGNLNADLNIKGTDEIAQTTKNIADLSNNLRSVIDFINKVGAKDFSASYELKGEDDHLGASLLNMKETLQTAEEENKKRRAEEKIRNWSTQGIAQFSELLRLNNDNMKELSFTIISNLIKFIDANQGGIFILHDNKSNKEEKPYFELTASYAYNRRKYLSQKMEWDEGLIGRVAQERKSLHLTDIPDDYLKITSGLGESKPSSILITPLMFNEEIYGIIELASFEVLEEHKVRFVEKISESIASTISSVRINIKTAQLLNESKDQSERLVQQEEELRQSMEEMHATQEEIQRKNRLLEQNEEELAKKAEGLEFENILFSTLMDNLHAQVAFKDIDAKYIRINKSKAETIGLHDTNEVVGKTDSELFSESYNQASVEEEIKKLAQGTTAHNKKGLIKLKDGGTKWGATTQIPLKDKSGKILGGLAMTSDITEQENAKVEAELLRALIDTLHNKLDLIFYRIDNNQNLTEFCGKGCRALGFGKDEESKMKFKIMFPEIYAKTADANNSIIEFNKSVTVNNEGISVRHLIYKNKTTSGGFTGIAFIGHSELASEETKTEDFSVYDISHTLIEWGEKYILGITTIDKQHKILVDIINQLYSAFIDGTSSIIIGNIIKKLIEYTDYHFGEEEKVFEIINYEESPEHKKEHASFVEKIKSFETDSENGSFSISQNLLDFLKQWLLNHILEKDKRYIEFFKQNGIQ